MPKLRPGRGWNVAESGAIVVADLDNVRVQVFNASGSVALVIGQQGTAAGQFNNPTGVVVGSDLRLTVTDTSNDRIQ